jgi:proline iminopeptidase
MVTKQQERTYSHEQSCPTLFADLFPETEPYSTGFLDVDDTHSIYWEQSGNPDGVPILFLHGGPGGGATAHDRRYFDPDHYRIIIFDQRGSGRSKPLGSLINNTVDHLLKDIEMLRAHLQVERWHIFGGSWGSTLGLIYAEKTPDRCLSLILHSIFLMDKEGVDWFIHGVKTIFPEAWEQFADEFGPTDDPKLLDKYYETLKNNEDPEKQMSAAVSWYLYEGACASLIPNYEIVTTDEQKQYALAQSRIEAHYFHTQTLDGKNGIIENIDKIRTIPTVLIQGRYDVLSPILAAHRLHQAWPEADYVIVSDGSHSPKEPVMRSRLIEATENAKNIKA